MYADNSPVMLADPGEIRCRFIYRPGRNPVSVHLSTAENELTPEAFVIDRGK